MTRLQSRSAPLALKPARAALAFALALAAAAALLACSGDDDGSPAGDAGRDGDGGFVLTDLAADAESFGADPIAVEFEEVAVGEVDIHAVDVVNRSTSPLRLTNIAIVQTDNTVTFANLFLGRMTDNYGWRDIDGDRQEFEERDQAITVIPGGRFEILVQYRPDGGLLECLDRPPANCGVLVITGERMTVQVELFVPREG